MSRGCSNIGWFWIGAGLGFIVSAGVVIISSEFTYLRKLRQGDPSFEQEEGDIIEDISMAVHDGMALLSRAAKEIQYSFEDARREVVRYGLAPQHEGHGGAGMHAWYTGDEEE